MEDDSSTPYANAAWAYRAAGYNGVIPLGRGPAQKSPPPSGYTGWAGVDPSGPDVQAWVDGREGVRNIGWHIPRTHVGVDVDGYHGGDESLIKLQRKVGEPLPLTWTSTARGPGGVSRHYFYRVALPEGRTWRDHPGVGIDMLHVGHRYAMVWPSVNPDADGHTVHWYDPEGELYEGVPDPAWFTELTPAWVDELSQEGVPLEGVGATDAVTTMALERMRPGPPCERVTAHLAKELDRITAAAAGAGSLHDPGQLYPLVAYGLEGHAGVREALSTHQAAYVQARSDGRGDTEAVGDADWWRQVRGAVGKRLHAGGTESMCRCDVENPPPEEPTATDPVEALRARLLDRDALNNVRPVTPLIKDVLDLDSESWIIGAPGGFKSFVALDWALHVALGKAWRGKRVTQGKVMYMAAEGEKGIPNRVRAWEIQYEQRAENILFLPMPVQVSNATAWGAWVELCRQEAPVMVVIDTQARVTSGLDENSNGQMSVLTEAVRRLRAATRACVLVVHHIGRNGQDARGASAIDGAQDVEWRVDRPTGKALRQRLTARLSCDKSKDGSDAEIFEIQMEIKRVGIDPEDGTSITSLALGAVEPFAKPEQSEPQWKTDLAGVAEEIMTVMTAHSGAAGATFADIDRWIMESRRERSETGTVAPLPKGTRSSAIKRLCADGRENEGKTVYLYRRGAARVILPEFAEGDE